MAPHGFACRHAVSRSAFGFDLRLRRFEALVSQRMPHRVLTAGVSCERYDMGRCANKSMYVYVRVAAIVRMRM